MKKFAATTWFIAVLSLSAGWVWPHPHISSDGFRVCAKCPKGFKNNVTWTTISGSDANHQWAEYINDAGGGYCSVNWKFIWDRISKPKEQQ
jgi:hypothetical protein